MLANKWVDLSGPTCDSFDNLILQSNIEEDLRSKCFICDLQAHELDRKAKVWSCTIMIIHWMIQWYNTMIHTMIIHWMFSFYYTFSGISKSCSARSQHVELCVLLLAHGFNRYQWPQCYTKICIWSCKSIYTSNVLLTTYMLTKANTIMNFILLWFILSFR